MRRGGTSPKPPQNIPMPIPMPTPMRIPMPMPMPIPCPWAEPWANHKAIEYSMVLKYHWFGINTKTHGHTKSHAHVTGQLNIQWYLNTIDLVSIPIPNSHINSHAHAQNIGTQHPLGIWHAVGFRPCEFLSFHTFTQSLLAFLRSSYRCMQHLFSCLRPLISLLVHQLCFLSLLALLVCCDCNLFSVCGHWCFCWFISCVSCPCSLLLFAVFALSSVVCMRFHPLVHHHQFAGSQSIQFMM